MDDPSLVRVFQPFDDLPGDRPGFVQRHRLMADPLGQRRPLHQFQGQGALTQFLPRVHPHLLPRPGAQTRRPVRRTASAQGGLKFGGFDRETQVFGLAATMGIASDTGVAGLTLGGGYGWLGGKYGLACDNLISAQVVTAEGTVVTASADENPDLFWGIRGGGGDFGIVTSLEFCLHPVGPVLGGAVFYPREQ